MFFTTWTHSKNPDLEVINADFQSQEFENKYINSKKFEF
jgi:hypothetical protein